MKNRGVPLPPEGWVFNRSPPAALPDHAIPANLTDSNDPEYRTDWLEETT
jgi:hypothetical protein